MIPHLLFLQRTQSSAKEMMAEICFMILTGKKYPSESICANRVNERRYEFGDENGAESWVCAKIPHDGAIKKDCVPKVID